MILKTNKCLQTCNIKKKNSRIKDNGCFMTIAFFQVIFSLSSITNISKRFLQNEIKLFEIMDNNDYELCPLREKKKFLRFFPIF